MTSFDKQIAEWTTKTKKRMDAAFKTALQDVAHDASESRYKGGRMPVASGFLRNSIVGGIGAMPAGPSDARTDAPGTGDISLQIARVKIGDTFYIGWSARYAEAMNARYAFRDAAAQKWPQFVDSAVREAVHRVR